MKLELCPLGYYLRLLSYSLFTLAYVLNIIYDIIFAAAEVTFAAMNCHILSSISAVSIISLFFFIAKFPSQN